MELGVPETLAVPLVDAVLLRLRDDVCVCVVDAVPLGDGVEEVDRV